MSSEETAASAPSDESQARPKGRPVLLIVALVVGVVIGVIYLKLLHVALDVLWTDIPNAINNEAFVGVYTAVMLVVGATAVVALRRSTGVFGQPTRWLAVRVDPIRSSLISLAAVIISLFSGAVLGPEGRPDRHGYCPWNVVRATEQGRRIQYREAHQDRRARCGDRSRCEHGCGSDRQHRERSDPAGVD